VPPEKLFQGRRDGAYDLAGGGAPDAGDDFRQPVLPERVTLGVRCLDDAVGVHEEKIAHLQCQALLGVRTVVDQSDGGAGRVQPADVRLAAVLPVQQQRRIVACVAVNEPSAGRIIRRQE
jgi:hypothetical protein